MLATDAMTTARDGDLREIRQGQPISIGNGLPRLFAGATNRPGSRPDRTGQLRKRTAVRRICRELVEDQASTCARLGLEENLQPFNGRT